MEHVLKGFRDGVKALDDKNDILTAKEEKNDICCQLMTDQVAQNKKFVIPENIFGDDTCPNCNGLGFKALFERTLSVRTCLKCDHGKKLVPCKKCQNGRYIRDKGGLKINVECKFCHGTKQREVKCRTCRGTGELKKMVITPKIKSITPCKHCHEMGFIDPEITAILEDTKKFEKIADQLVTALIDSTSEKDKGENVDEKDFTTINYQ